MVSSLSNVFLLSEINFNLISFVLRVDNVIIIMIEGFQKKEHFTL